MSLLASEDGPGGMTRVGQRGDERRDAAPEGGRDADAGEGVWWAGVTNLPSSSRYATRSTDTFRCSCRKRGPGI